jgi:OFA family oxalate/formate antiporter-like MFS transporter
MFGLQVLLFWLLPSLTAVTLMTIITFVVLMCYGGGFGTMPAFAADYFGSKNVGPIYGLMLTAWGCASIAGPGMIAYMRQTTGSYNGALHVIAGVMAVSALLPVLVSRPGGGVIDSRVRPGFPRGLPARGPHRTERSEPTADTQIHQHLRNAR